MWNNVCYATGEGARVDTVDHDDTDDVDIFCVCEEPGDFERDESAKGPSCLFVSWFALLYEGEQSQDTSEQYFTFGDD